MRNRLQTSALFFGCVLILLGLVSEPSRASASFLNSRCSVPGKIMNVAGSKFKCAIVAKTLRWTRVPAPAPAPTPAKRSQVSYKATVTADEIRTKVSFGKCTALLPSGYTTANATNSSAGEFVSPDKKFYGAWVIRPINTSQLQTMSDQSLGIDPAVDSNDPKVQILATAGLSAKFLGYDTKFTQYGSSFDSNGYTAFEARSSNARAILIYKNPVIQGDGYTSTYIAVDRMAIAPLTATDRQLDSLARDALSIQCSVQYSPPSSDAFSSSAHSSAQSGEGPAPTQDDVDSTLGTAWITDSSTGDLYNVSLNDWSQDPCGSGQSGWAKVVGNNCTVLGH